MEQINVKRIQNKLIEIESLIKNSRYEDLINNYDLDYNLYDILLEYYRKLFSCIIVDNVEIVLIKYAELSNGTIEVNIEITVEYKFYGRECIDKTSQIWLFKLKDNTLLQLSGIFYINMLSEYDVKIQIIGDNKRIYFKTIINCKRLGDTNICLVKLSFYHEKVLFDEETYMIDCVNNIYIIKFEQYQEDYSINCTYESQRKNILNYYSCWFPLLKSYPPNEHRLCVKYLGSTPNVVTVGKLEKNGDEISWTCMNAHGEALVYADEHYETILYHGLQLNYFWNHKEEDLKDIIKCTCIEIIDLFNNIIEFPYESFTFILLDDLNYATCQSGLLIFDSYIIKNFKIEDIKAYLSHEIAHNWWGSSYNFFSKGLTWLYEGIADYYELLYRRKRLGECNYQDKLKQLNYAYDDINQRDDIFGCLYLVKLEELIGEELMIELLKKIYKDKRNFCSKLDFEDLVREHIFKAKE